MQKLKATLKCPSCKKSFEINVEQMIPNTSMKCPNQPCKGLIEFSGDDGRKTQQALDDLQASFKQFGDNFKITL